MPSSSWYALSIMANRKWNEIPFIERDDLLTQYDTDKQALKEKYPMLGLSMSLVSLEAKLREHKNYRTLYLETAFSSIEIPKASPKVYLDNFEIEGDVIIISDIEMPDQSVEYLIAALMVAMRNNIRTLIIAGNLIASDADSLNSWVTTLVEDGELGYETSVNLVRFLLLELAKWFTEIYIIEGNHDDRVARTTGGAVHLGMLIHGTIAQYSRFHFMWLNTARGPVYITHPDNFSSDPVRLGAELYDVSPRKGHVVVTHCHRKQRGWTKDGCYEVMAIGTGRDPHRTKYKAVRANKHRQWDSSFLMVKGGYFYDFDLKSTDWRFWLGDMYTLFEQRILALDLPHRLLKQDKESKADIMLGQPNLMLRQNREDLCFYFKGNCYIGEVYEAEIFEENERCRIMSECCVNCIYEAP